MFDVGWSELLVIAVVLIVVVGPKDLPGMLRQFGRTTKKLRVMANDFRKQFDEALEEADLGDVKDLAGSVRKFDPRSEIRKHLSPMEKAGEDIKRGFDEAMKPKRDTSAEPAASETHEAEPLKTAATSSDDGKAAKKAASGKSSRAAKKTGTRAASKPAAAAPAKAGRKPASTPAKSTANGRAASAKAGDGSKATGGAGKPAATRKTAAKAAGADNAKAAGAGVKPAKTTKAAGKSSGGRSNKPARAAGTKKKTGTTT